MVVIRSGKGDTYREVPLNAKVREALNGWIKERNKRFSQTSDPAFFLNPKGKRLSARSIDLIIRRIGADADLELSAHVLRHTCLTNLVRHGNDLVLVAEIAGPYGGKTSTSQENQESFRHSKTDFLHRHILEYQLLFQEIARLSDGDSYLFLDDLYHIRRSDQAKVIDYFHSVAKGNNLWLKIGTIRHRTQWYINGDPPIGLKLGDDADFINLDLTLEKYQITKQFLCQILDGFIDSNDNWTFKQILNDGGTDRLVLASGGVARDFLGIFRGAVSVARERGIDDRGDKVGVEDVNTAAGDYDSTKREELKKDTDDQKVLIEEFQQVVSFCLNETKANIFLLPKDASLERKAHIAELVDLRFLHKVKDRVTLKKAPGQIFEAYMLDVSQYTGSRAKRGFEIVDDWHKDKGETLRRDKFVYDPKENSNDLNTSGLISSKSSSKSTQSISSKSQLLTSPSLWDQEGENKV